MSDEQFMQLLKRTVDIFDPTARMIRESKIQFLAYMEMQRNTN